MSERLALIIAASEFHDRRFRRLRAPALDAKQLSAVLKDPAVGGFTDVKVVLNQPRQVIEEAIEALFANRQPGDLALLYFSCHGITDRHGQLRFVTTPTRFDRLGSTTVSSMFVKDQMELSRARSKVVLLDCCHGGAFARGFVPKSADEMDLTGQVQSRGSVVIASSGALQYAFDDDRLTSDQTKPSLFTGAVVEGLGTGEADRDGDGRISARDLFDYVYDRVRAATTDQTPTWPSIWSPRRHPLGLGAGTRPTHLDSGAARSARSRANLAPSRSADRAAGCLRGAAAGRRWLGPTARLLHRLP